MAPSGSTARYEIQYDTQDPVVRRCLEKASMYRVLVWMQLGVFALVALLGIFEDSGRFGALAAMVGVPAAISAMLEANFRKSAWIRTLELRIDRLQALGQDKA